MEELTLTQAESALPAAAPAAGTAIATTRETQEVQAAVFMAKQFPRNENAAIARIQRACQRRGLAEKAIYSYPKGGQNVTGPSIRLAEAIAQAWGNIQSGVVELEQRDGESLCMAYCWDIETNTRECKTFVVPHVMQTKKGAKVLTDPRDIYEHVANQGARRKRACILNVIPGDVVDNAIRECCKTLASGNKQPLIDRCRAMAQVFADELSVPLSCLEKYMGYSLDSFTEMDVVTLRGVYTAIKDGARREDYFDLPKPKEIPQETPTGEPQQVSLNDI